MDGICAAPICTEESLVHFFAKHTENIKSWRKSTPDWNRFNSQPSWGEACIKRSLENVLAGIWLNTDKLYPGEIGREIIES